MHAAAVVSVSGGLPFDRGSNIRALPFYAFEGEVHESTVGKEGELFTEGNLDLALNTKTCLLNALCPWPHGCTYLQLCCINEGQTCKISYLHYVRTA